MSDTAAVTQALIFSDLDGTLIFSAERKQDGDIVVERKDGREISCITPRQAELLPRLRIIPVTTRSIEQYKRICIRGFCPKYALVDNGGTLLINGIPDPEWTRASMKAVHACSSELSECRKILERDENRIFEIRMVDEMFLFTKSAQPQMTLRALEAVSGGNIQCCSTGQKVYAVPRGISKGTAAKRLAERLSPNAAIVCAGDSKMDIPLLNIADIAVFPDDIDSGEITAKATVTAARERFSQTVTECFLKS